MVSDYLLLAEKQAAARNAQIELQRALSTGITMMNLRLALTVALVVAARIAPALAASIPLCSEQQNCLEFSHSVVASSACRPNADCAVQVCMQYDNGPGCIKGGDSISHMCDSGDTNGCLRTANLFDGSGEQSCGLDGSNVGEKCAIAQLGIQLCQEAEAGETVYFVVKDGNLAKDAATDTYTAVSNDVCSAASLTCAVANDVGVGNCGNNTQQAEKEMVWAYTVPDNACDCGSTTASPT